MTGCRNCITVIPSPESVWGVFGQEQDRYDRRVHSPDPFSYFKPIDIRLVKIPNEKVKTTDGINMISLWFLALLTRYPHVLVKNA